MHSHAAALHRTIMAVDVAGYSNPMRTLDHQAAVHDGFYGILHSSLADVGVPWDGCLVENAGDGAMIQLPPGAAKAGLVAELPDRIVAGLRRHNAIHAAEASIQLRVALHAGEVRPASHGSISQAVILTARLLDAAGAKEALRQSGAPLALVVSESLFREVVEQDAAADAGSYRPIPVDLKGSTTMGWLRLLGGPPAWTPMPAPESAATVSPPRDSFGALVDALLAVPCVRKSESRGLLLEMFPRPEIAAAVPYHAEDRLHVIALARTCQRYAGGMADLLAAIRLLDPGSPQVERLASLVEARPDQSVG